MIYSAETCRLFEMAHQMAEGNHRAAAMKKSGTPEAEEQLAWAQTHQAFATAFHSARRDMTPKPMDGSRIRR